MARKVVGSMLAACSFRHGYYAGATRRLQALLWAEIARLRALLGRPGPYRTRRWCGWARAVD